MLVIKVEFYLVTQSLLILPFYIFVSFVLLGNHPPLMLPHTSVPITDRSQLTGTRYLFFESSLRIQKNIYRFLHFALTRSLGLSEKLCGLL
jgi:hypothetical protein